MPVLPLVSYTGTRPWDSPVRLTDLIERGDEFEAVTPSVTPLFLNRSSPAPNRLESTGGFFGRALRLVQERKARPEEWAGTLERVVRQMERMPADQRMNARMLARPFPSCFPSSG